MSLRDEEGGEGVRYSAGNKFPGSRDRLPKVEGFSLNVFHSARERLSGTKYPRIPGPSIHVASLPAN